MYIILLASFLVSLVSFVGALFLLSKKNILQQYSSHLVSFAAGVMLTTAFLDVLPEALEEGTDTNLVFASSLFGVVFLFFLERFVLWFHHHDNMHNMKPSAILVIIGDSFHNFIDGIAIAATFLTNFSLGVATTLAIIAHEIPHEIADYSVLIYGGFTSKKALLFNFLSALTSLLGALVGFYLLQRVQTILPLFLGLTGGMFIYIACSDLIPDLHTEFKRQKSWAQSFVFILGVFIAWGIITVLKG